MLFPPRARKTLTGAVSAAAAALALGLAPVFAAGPALAPALADAGPRLSVPPVLGLEDAPAGALAEAMARALSRRGLWAEAKTAHSAAGGGFVITGRARIIERRAGLLWAGVYWTVRPPGGGARMTRVREIAADSARWAAGDAQVMRYAAAETGAGVLRILAQLGLNIGPEAPEAPAAAAAAETAPGLPAPESPPRPAPENAETAAAAPSPPPPWPGAPVFWVRAVRGAPGGGGPELTQAMRRALAGRGAGAAAEESAATHIVQGAVSMSEVFAGTQRARIVWRVTAAGGAPVGAATQENEIAAGALDGPWGGLADHIAAAAADGVRRLFAP